MMQAAALQPRALCRCRRAGRGGPYRHRFAADGRRAGQGHGHARALATACCASRGEQRRVLPKLAPRRFDHTALSLGCCAATPRGRFARPRGCSTASSRAGTASTMLPCARASPGSFKVFRTAPCSTVINDDKAIDQVSFTATKCGHAGRRLQPRARAGRCRRRQRIAHCGSVQLSAEVRGILSTSVTWRARAGHNRGAGGGIDGRGASSTRSDKTADAYLMRASFMTGRRSSVRFSVLTTHARRARRNGRRRWVRCAVVPTGKARRHFVEG